MATLGQGKGLSGLGLWASLSLEQMGLTHFSSKGLIKGLRPDFFKWAANEWYPP